MRNRRKVRSRRDWYARELALWLNGNTIALIWSWLKPWTALRLRLQDFHDRNVISLMLEDETLVLDK